MNPVEIIVSNFPHCEEWRDDSFLGVLDDLCEIQKDKYWQLEWAILEYTKEGGKPYDLNWPIFRIFSHAMSLFRCHYNTNDGYEIKNVNDDVMQNFTERFQLVFEGFFKGQIPCLRSYSEKNPLLADDYFD
jgi:Immunity protein 41